MKEMLARFIKDEEGATMVEYGLIVALIAVAGILALTGLGDQLILLWNKITGAIAAAMA